MKGSQNFMNNNPTPDNFGVPSLDSIQELPTVELPKFDQNQTAPIAAQQPISQTQPMTQTQPIPQVQPMTQPYTYPVNTSPSYVPPAQQIFIRKRSGENLLR